MEIGKLQKITAFYVREVPITDEMYRDIQEKFNVKPADLETFKKDISELRSWLHFVRIFEK